MENKRENRTAGIFYTLCGGVCWGLSGCFGQYLFQEKSITAEWLVSIRLTAAGILLLLVGFLLQGKTILEPWKHPADRKRLVVFAIAGMLTCQYTYFAAIQYSNAGIATVLQSLNVLMILCFVCMKGKRMPRFFEVLAIICALVGVFLLSTHGDMGSLSIGLPALIFGLLAALSAAVYNLLSGDILRNYGVYAIVGAAMLIAGIVMLAVVRPWTYGVKIDKETLLALAGVIVIGTAVAFSLYLKGVSIIGPFMGSLLAMVEPITAVAISFLFLGAGFEIIDFVGFVLILGTVVALSLPKKE